MRLFAHLPGMVMVDDAENFWFISHKSAPVTSGTLLEVGGCASIYDVSTPLGFRYQGFGGACLVLIRESI